MVETNARAYAVEVEQAIPFMLGQAAKPRAYHLLDKVLGRVGTAMYSVPGG